MSASSVAASGRRLARRPLAAGALAGGAVVAVVVVVLVLALGGEEAASPPAAAATRLVPANALVYVHLSTDTSRAGTARAERLAKGFPGYAAARGALLRRLAAPSCGVDVGRLRGGREAALALLDTGGGTAGSLVLVDTGRSGTRPERTCGAVQVAQIGRFLVIGQPQTLQLAHDLARGHGRSLAEAPAYQHATAELPVDRVLDAWASRDGVRRLLAPQGGLLGAAGLLLDQPALKGAALGLTAGGAGARLTVKSVLDPAARRRAGASFTPFRPTLQAGVPASAFAYLGLSGLSSAAGRLLAALGPQAAQLAPLLGRAGRSLAPLARAFRGEVAVTLTSAVPAPTFTLIARATDEARSAADLHRLQAPLARLLARPGQAPPAWRRVGGTFQLRLATGIELDYAVFAGKVVASTRLAGIDAVRRAQDHLPDTRMWRATIGNTQIPVTSLVFLDFNQLLRLAEETGLNRSRTYLAVQHDLRRVKAVGARSTSDGDESTAELDLSIP